MKIQILKIRSTLPKYVVLNATHIHYIGYAESENEVIERFDELGSKKFMRLSRKDLRNFLLSREEFTELRTNTTQEFFFVSHFRGRRAFRIGCCLFKGKNFTTLTRWIRSTKK